MKRKLLNALRLRMGWLGYEFGQVTNPFEKRFCIAVKNPDGKSRVVFVNESNTDYDFLASNLHEYPEMTDATLITRQEETSDDN